MKPLKKYMGKEIEVRVYNVFNRGFNVVWNPINKINYTKSKHFDKEIEALNYANDILR